MDTSNIDIDVLRRRLEHRLVGCRIFHHQVIDSSMDEIHKLAKEGEREGTVVVACTEIAARGRFNRSWLSSPGKNVSFSVLLRPSVSQMNYVNMAITLAVLEVVGDFTNLIPTIKWPNDIMIKGRKVSGILIESEIAAEKLMHAVVGVGINVNFNPAQFQEIAHTATSMQLETGLLFNRTQLLGSVIAKIDDYYSSVRRGESLVRFWTEKLETIGQSIQVKWNGKVFEGRASGVDEQGNLVLVRADGTDVTLLAGEVTMQL